MRGTAICAAGFCAALALAGCSSLAPHTLQIDSAAGSYQSVTLNYRVDGGQLSEPLTVARIHGRQVTQERLPSPPSPNQSVVRLAIRYPHPNGKAGLALAELVVETHTPPSAQSQTQSQKAFWQQWSDSFAAAARDILPGMSTSDDIFESWALDISKSDLDRVIQGMSLSGYFVNPSKQAVGVELAVRIDNFQATKSWTREPELDILMERVRQEGRLVSYRHPHEPAAAGVPGDPHRPPVPVQPQPPQNYTPPGRYPLPSYYAPPGSISSTAPPVNNPSGGWALPPQYPRAAAPPGQAPAAAPQDRAGNAAAAPAGQQAPGRSWSFRWPWQSEPQPVSNANQPNPAPVQTGGHFDPRQPPPPGYSAAAQQSPSGWNPAPPPRRFGQPYAPIAQANAPAGGYPGNLPQPPQVQTTGARY